MSGLFIPIEAVTKEIDVDRTTLREYMDILGMTVCKIQTRSKQGTFITATQFEQLKEYKENRVNRTGKRSMKIQCPDCKNIIQFDLFGRHVSQFCMKITNRVASNEFFTTKIFPIMKALERCEITPNEAETQVKEAFKNRKIETPIEAVK